MQHLSDCPSIVHDVSLAQFTDLTIREIKNAKLLELIAQIFPLKF